MPTAEALPNSLSNRLRLARTELGLTQAGAARAIGITQPMLHRAETSLQLSTNRLLLILDYYINSRQINPAWLLCEPNTQFQIRSTEASAESITDQKLRLLANFCKDLNALGEQDKAAR